MRIRSLVLAAAVAATLAPHSAGAADYVFRARPSVIASASTETPPVPQAPAPVAPTQAGTFAFRPGETYRTSRPLVEVVASIPNRTIAISRALIWTTPVRTVNMTIGASSNPAADADRLLGTMERAADDLSATFELDAAGHLVVTRYGTVASGALVLSDRVNGSTVGAFDFVAP